MMHEPEKSDPSTVASKPANKPDGPGAESAERREGAEGNTSPSILLQVLNLRYISI